MKPTLAVLSGARAGVVTIPAGDRFLAGRSASAELRFDPHADLAVSTEHAEFTCVRGVWYIRDLASRNGTWLDGRRITGPAALHDGAVITFGADGPRVRFEMSGAPAVLHESTTSRLRAAVSREVTRIRIGAGAALLVVLALGGAVLIGDQRERAEIDAERQLLRSRVDSLLAVGRTTEAAVEDEVVGLRSALQESEARLQSLRAEIASAPAPRAARPELEQQLHAASTALRRQQLAASLDFTLIQQRNRAAVAMVWVEFSDGRRVTGTAFAATAGAILITSAHLVAAQDGAPVRRVAVRFADSEQVFPARVVAVARNTDLAALQVDNLLGRVPTVHGLDARAGVDSGSPVALIGFPLGGEPDSGSRVARPLLSAGVVSRVLPDRLEVQGLGAAGGSGSPLLNADGELVGVLYGGRTDEGVQLLSAVPVSEVRALLATLR